MLRVMILEMILACYQISFGNQLILIVHKLRERKINLYRKSNLKSQNLIEFIYSSSQGLDVSKYTDKNSHSKKLKDITFETNAIESSSSRVGDSDLDERGQHISEPPYNKDDIETSSFKNKDLDKIFLDVPKNNTEKSSSDNEEDKNHERHLNQALSHMLSDYGVDRPSKASISFAEEDSESIENSTT